MAIGVHEFAVLGYEAFVTGKYIHQEQLEQYLGDSNLQFLDLDIEDEIKQKLAEHP